MKKILWIMIAAIGLTACGKTNEEKANELIKKEMNKVIVNIDTYEPIETIVDSAFAPTMTPEFFSLLEGLPAQMRKYLSLQSGVSEAQRLMSIYERPYSAHDRVMYNQYKEQYESALRQLEELESKLKTINENVEKLNQEEPVFNGYRVNHQYRYTKEDGNKAIGKYIFLVNKDFSAIQAKLDMEDPDIKEMFEMFEMSNFGK